ncbi:MAG: hypothetical protein JSV91_11535 [Phycisphaerales bacterium]|nr:MAG: hypothetical protein JSV91_11535 [Phycisphaerales bacterium]
MSQFFSKKYLRYFGRSIDKTTIEKDTLCPNCDYNLRGLPRDRRCPECGWDPLALVDEEERKIVAESKVERRPLIDAMSAAAGGNRSRLEAGLTVAALCLAAVVIARAVFFVLAASGAGENAYKGYLFIGLLVSIAWTIATALILPARLGGYWRWVRPLRTFVIATQWLWIVAYVVWMVDVVQTGGKGVTGLTVAQILLRLMAGTGVVALAVVMRQVAEEAEIELAARRFNTAAWLLPILSPLALALAAAFTPPAGGFTSGPWGMVQAIFLLPPAAALLGWCWLLSLMALAMWRMRQHTAWTVRHERDAIGRDERVARKREWLERKAAEKVRPIGGQASDPGDLVCIEEDLPCPDCGYNLRGLAVGRRCPECGCDPADNPAFEFDGDWIGD